VVVSANCNTDVGIPSAEAYTKHSDEIFKRLRWCLDHSKFPAHDNVHLAPGDDRNFILGVSPYNADGSPNPAGIPGTVEDVRYRGCDSELLEDELFDWECRKCQKNVSSRAREYVGSPEPFYWWWCPACRSDVDIKPASKKNVSVRQKDMDRVAAKCRKISFK